MKPNKFSEKWVARAEYELMTVLEDFWKRQAVMLFGVAAGILTGALLAVVTR